MRFSSNLVSYRLSIPLENFRRDLRSRLETDKQMSGAWAIVPLLPLIMGVGLFVAFIAIAVSSLGSAGTTPTPGTSTALVAGLFAFLSLLYLVYFLVIILVAVLIFRLVRRRNMHFNRQILLYEDLLSVAKELASKKNTDVSILINNMDRNLREARLDELEKNATLWAILSFGFGAGLFYAGYFLMKDFYRHERREDMFIQDLLRTFYTMGVTINLPYRTSPVPDRSFALYFVLTLMTGSIFAVYWVYVLVPYTNIYYLQQTLGLLGTLAFATSTGVSFLVSSLISRQNKHAEREQEIAWEILNGVQSRTRPEQMHVLLPLSSAEQDFSILLQRTRQHSAILWSLLVLIPYAGWVFVIAALFLLTRDSNIHETMERSLFEDLDRTVTAGGWQRAALDGQIPPSRNGTLYAIASVLTVGIVAISWLYVMIIGEEAHFRFHSVLEPRLLEAFSNQGGRTGSEG